jgi:hypothetical protein
METYQFVLIPLILIELRKSKHTFYVKYVCILIVLIHKIIARNRSRGYTKEIIIDLSLNI